MNANERSGSCDSKRPFFYLPGLHCRGSFEMLAVIPASNEWCRIGSCCLSMFELWLSKSCFTKVSAPVDSAFPIQGGSVTGWVLENSLYKKGVPPSHHLMGNATVETSITTWPPLMCVSVLIVCFENKHGQSYLFLKVIVTTTFQWLFAERFFHHQDGLKSRTLFVIPHIFFWGIMLSSFQKSDTLFLHKPGPSSN